MRIPAASCTAVRAVLAGGPQQLTWLGAGPSAVYLLTRTSAVLAIVAHDAVRLPCAIVVPRRSDELPLSAIAPDAVELAGATAVVGEGRITWHGRRGRVTVTVARYWAPARPTAGTPVPRAVREARDALRGRELGVARDVIRTLRPLGGPRHGDASAVVVLLGRGPGLTPSGDDVLAGFLIGARAFGPPASAVAARVADLAPARTTALSAQLLRHAADGDCIPQVATLVDALVGRTGVPAAVDGLLAVGHTSGAALAAGVLAAAEGAPSFTHPLSTRAMS